MKRTYICTWFTCLTHTSKMALLNGLSTLIIQLRWNRAIESGRVRWEFRPLARFQTQKYFEKTCYQCISLCRFVCLEPRFKAFESLKLLILPCYFPKYWYNFASKDLPMTSTTSVGKIKTRPFETFWKKTTRYIRRFKYFQETFVTMFWHLEHWPTLYLQ